MNEFKYLRRPAYKDDGNKWREASIYHLLAEGGKKAVCGQAKLGVNGFEIVVKERKVLKSMTCLNCQLGRR